jgi:hypothetical protein
VVDLQHAPFFSVPVGNIRKTHYRHVVSVQILHDEKMRIGTRNKPHEVARGSW